MLQKAGLSTKEESKKFGRGEKFWKIVPKMLGRTASVPFGGSDLGAAGIVCGTLARAWGYHQHSTYLKSDVIGWGEGYHRAHQNRQEQIKSQNLYTLLAAGSNTRQALYKYAQKAKDSCPDIRNRPAFRDIAETAIRAYQSDYDMAIEEVKREKSREISRIERPGPIALIFGADWTKHVAQQFEDAASAKIQRFEEMRKPFSWAEQLHKSPDEILGMISTKKTVVGGQSEANSKTLSENIGLETDAHNADLKIWEQSLETDWKNIKMCTDDNTRERLSRLEKDHQDAAQALDNFKRKITAHAHRMEILPAKIEVLFPA